MLLFSLLGSFASSCW